MPAAEGHISLIREANRTNLKNTGGAIMIKQYFISYFVKWQNNVDDKIDKNLKIPGELVDDFRILEFMKNKNGKRRISLFQLNQQKIGYS